MIEADIFCDIAGDVNVERVECETINELNRIIREKNKKTSNKYSIMEIYENN